MAYLFVTKYTNMGVYDLLTLNIGVEHEGL